MGGTFDPIHYGHLILAQNALDTFSLDEILFVPSGTPWLKESTKVLSKNKRVSMTGMAIEDNPDFALSTIEIDREGNSYSYETVEELKRMQPKTDFYFIMGADSLDYFEEWRHPEIICEKAAVLVAVRDHWDMDDIKKKINAIEKQFDAAIYPLSCGRFDAASRDIRQQIKNGVNTDQLLPDSVIRFIKEHQLYESRK